MIFNGGTILNHMDPPVNGINRMDPPASGDEIKPKKIEEANDGGPLFHCDLLDSEVVYEIAQALLPGLASACVDNTTGDFLRSSESVAVDIRREMVDYLFKRSETFVAESVVLEGVADTDVSDNPFDIISNFIDDFAASKRNFLSKVSGWILSDRREDQIDDFIQGMELGAFWLIGRRETVARTLLKNVDFKNAFHCDMKFKASEELKEHRSRCSFRNIICTHEGCDSRFSACHVEQHESVCPFKILPCEQKCPERIMRREMDRHCITVCKMKLVNCPFYSVGCQSTIPQCKMDEHYLDNVQSHILHVLRMSHKGVCEDRLKKRLEEIEKISSPDNLASLRNARSLTNAVKNYERNLGPIEESNVDPEPDVEDGNSKDKKETTSSSSSEDNLILPNNNGEVQKSTNKEPEPKETPEKNDSEGSLVSEREVATKSPLQEYLNKSPDEKEKVVDSPASEREVASQSSSGEDDLDKKSPNKEKEKYENTYLRKEENAVTQSQQESTESLKELRESATETPKRIDHPTEEHIQSTSWSDESTLPVKRDGIAKSPTGMEEQRA
ncbi:hypothetical protein Leryth_012460 [Lithospermum erythrorhizon]|nr:hypothetical protein Leryth_012460 [Lithospermum erythrorhizon]